VNVASRIEQLNKQFGTGILATESTVRAAGAFESCVSSAQPTSAATKTSWSIASVPCSERTDIRHDGRHRAIRRRYLLMATSSVVVDMAFALVFIVMNGAWSFAPRSLGAGIILLGGINWVVARRLFAPIERYLKGEASFEDTQRRITQLPLLTARTVAILALLLTIFRLSATYLFTDPGITGVPQPTIAQVVTLCFVLPAFYFTFTYFVISDYLADLCAFIFRHRGRNLELFFGSYNAKLVSPCR